MHNQGPAALCFDHSLRDVKTQATAAIPSTPEEHPPVRRSLWDLAEGARSRSRGYVASAYLPWTIVAIGVLIRLVRYAADRSLWLDEAYLALNLKGRSYGDLIGTLDFNQAAPPLFLFIEKAVMGVFGDSEYALRLFPFAAAIGSMVLAYPVARRYLSPRAVPVALLFFAVLEPFAFFGAEVKQYSSDILVTLVLLYLCARAVDAETRAFPRWIAAIAVAGIVGVSLSYPSAFVLAGVACAVLYSAIMRRDRTSILWVVTTFGLILVAFLVTFIVSIHKGRAVQASAASISGDSRIVVKNLYLVFTDPAGLPRTVVGLAAVVALLGFVSILRRSRALALLFAGCLASVFVTGLAGEYPIG
ncbi:MAG: hypothetical protein QOE13_790, partial [Gaiellaceae bacterium]|nr:hypothetical protein [Gaiellaceae bacterium]